ncbi:MAG TPA: transaldolase family protein [Anaeromyxobacteraceae bacterium]|nr:transaldolase family protein [Anaeromyxobacteraceae bacterium]
MTLPAAAKPYRSALHQMTQTTPTCLWNDSADLEELTRSIADGAVGATCNPVIALGILKKAAAAWKPRIQELASAHPTASEGEIGWMLIEELSVKAAALLEPTFRAQKGRNGRLSIQTDPRHFRDPAALADQAEAFNRLAPNMIVKIPATKAGIPAMEEATYRGISINATVSFTLPQCIAVAEAVERGLRRREKEGKDVASMGPVCTIMVGRLDDWMKVTAERDGITVDPGVCEWAGVAVFKKAYRIFEERGYRIRLLSAAFRNHMHWSELVGGDCVISPPYPWQARLNAAGIAPEPRMDRPVEPRILDTLQARFPEFRKAYEADGLSIPDFDGYGATRRTLRQFLGACHELETLVRDVVVPNPDK